MATSGTRSIRDKRRETPEDDLSDEETQEAGAPAPPESAKGELPPNGGAFANDGNVNEIDLSGGLERAVERSSVQDLTETEAARDDEMRNFAMIAPDDYRQRMRAQTHIAAANLHSDETVRGGMIINKRGQRVNADGKRVDKDGGLVD